MHAILLLELQMLLLTPSPFWRVSPGRPPCWPGQGQEELGRGRQEAEPRCWGGVGPRKVWLSEPSSLPAPQGSGRGEVCGDPAPQPPRPPGSPAVQEARTGVSEGMIPPWEEAEVGLVQHRLPHPDPASTSPEASVGSGPRFPICEVGPSGFCSVAQGPCAELM